MSQDKDDADAYLSTDRQPGMPGRVSGTASAVTYPGDMADGPSRACYRAFRCPPAVPLGRKGNTDSLSGPGRPSPSAGR